MSLEEKCLTMLAVLRGNNNCTLIFFRYCHIQIQVNIKNTINAKNNVKRKTELKRTRDAQIISQLVKSIYKQFVFTRLTVKNTKLKGNAP